MPANSFVVIIVAIGAVITLFAGDHYYRYIDKKRGQINVIEIDDDQNSYETREHIQLSFLENEERNVEVDNDNLAA